ncbi:MAG: PorT family protein, partial [Ferruginibacter sp.]
MNFILLFAFLIPFVGKAQIGYEQNLLEHDDERFHFGINLGLNRSHYNILHSKRFLAFDSINVIESINSTGINLAGLVNLRLSSHFDVRTYPINLIFTEKVFQYTLKTPDVTRLEDTLVTKKVQGITLALPLQLKFTSDRIDNLKVFMMVGARVDYDLAANAGKKNTEDQITL